MDKFINLSNFFAVFVALNISYTGFKWFRIIINNEFLKLASELSKLSEKLDQFIISFSVPDETTKKLKREKEHILFSLNTRYESIKTMRENNSTFEHSYHKIFLSSALFCIGMVLLIGLAQQNDKERDDFLLTIISYSFLIVILELYIFITGWFNNPVNGEPTFTEHWLWKFISWFIIPSKNNTTITKHWLWKIFFWFTRLFKGELIIPKLKKPIFIMLFLSIYALGILIAYLNQKGFLLFPKFEVSECVCGAIFIAILPSFLFLIRAFFYKRKNKSICKTFSSISETQETEFLNRSKNEINLVISEIEKEFKIQNNDES